MGVFGVGNGAGWLYDARRSNGNCSCTSSPQPLGFYCFQSNWEMRILDKSKQPVRLESKASCYFPERWVMGKGSAAEDRSILVPTPKAPTSVPLIDTLVP
jgi:hypothetical protein